MSFKPAVVDFFPSSNVRRLKAVVFTFAVFGGERAAQAQTVATTQTVAFPRRGAWIAVGGGLANHGLALGQAQGWYRYDQAVVGIRLTDAQTPWAAAGSAIRKVSDQALLVGWTAQIISERYSLLLSGGLTKLHDSETRGDNRVLTHSITEIGGTAEAQLGLRFSRHFGLGLSIYSARSSSISAVGGAMALRAGQIP